MCDYGTSSRRLGYGLMGVRAIILVLALVAGLSWPAAPRANAFTLLEWSVVLSLIKNQLNVVCFAESPNGDNVQAAIDGIRQGLATYAPEVTLVLGTAAADTLIGTDGPDLIFGFGGNDVISGLGGNDFICGGPGDDVLIGGPGDDTLIGDPGNDQIFPDERPLPQREEDCKNDGWQQYGMFKTQGDCVSYVATGGRNPGAL